MVCPTLSAGMSVPELFTKRLLKWAVILTILFSINDVGDGPIVLGATLVGWFVTWSLLLAAGKATRAALDRRLGYA